AKPAGARHRDRERAEIGSGHRRLNDRVLDADEIEVAAIGPHVDLRGFGRSGCATSWRACRVLGGPYAGNWAAGVEREISTSSGVISAGTLANSGVER